MTRFTDYQDLIEANGGGVLDWRHELQSETGQLVATTLADDVKGDVIEWGVTMPPMQAQTNRISKRTARIFVDVTDSSLLPSVGNPLHPDSNSKVVTYAGIVGADGETIWRPQGAMVISEASAVRDGGTVVAECQLADPLHRLRSDLVDSFKFEAGETVNAVAARLAEQVLEPGTFDITEGGGCTVPGGSFQSGKERLQIIAELLEGCGHELTSSPLGFISARPIPPSDDDESAERWRYGTDGLAIDAIRRVWKPRVPQAWKIEGGSFRNASVSPTVTVFDQDPSSEGYVGREGVRRVGSSRLPFVQAISQAVEAGYAQLRRNGTGPRLVEIDVLPNPMMEEGDLLTVTDEEGLDSVDATGTYRVLDYRLPIQVDGMMTVLARGVYDPGLGYVPPADRGEGCVTSILDSFDRPNQNLEDLESSSGSTDWTEVGWSWGIEGEAAVQRYANGWSLAFVNTPLCSSDQYAEVEIGVIPSGRQIGPAVRSSGEFDCYVALADSAGVVRLEMWRAGSRVATLGSHSSGVSLAGRRLRLSAVGKAITVTLSGAEVIEVEDDRRTGLHIGMQAYGGPSGNAPSALSFAAGVAS